MTKARVIADAQGRLLRRGVMQGAVLYLFAIPPSLLGLAVILAVVRAKQDDLPDIVRALMRFRGDDDERNSPPSLPTP